MADKNYNYLDEWKASAKKNKKKTTKAGKRKKILGLQGLQTFASTYKPKTTKRNANS
tara:strand:+ start:99 stop:269 length:171 start_codon:yes stop_codon:yes gene_type:complete